MEKKSIEKREASVAVNKKGKRPRQWNEEGEEEGEEAREEQGERQKEGLKEVHREDIATQSSSNKPLYVLFPHSPSLLLPSSSFYLSFSLLLLMFILTVSQLRKRYESDDIN